MSAAENYWHDLHSLLNSSAEIGYDNKDEKQKTTSKFDMIKKHPHIVDEYFEKRVKDFF